MKRQHGDEQARVVLPCYACATGKPEPQGEYVTLPTLTGEREFWLCTVHADTAHREIGDQAATMRARQEEREGLAESVVEEEESID